MRGAILVLVCTAGAAAQPGILNGPVVNPANGHSYYLLQPSTWTDAEAAAVVLGGHLATVRSADENEFLRASVLGFDMMDRRGWIGLNDLVVTGTFAWVSGDPVGYTNWNAGEPNNIGIEHYTELFYSNGEWNNNTNNPPFLEFGLVEVIGGGCYPNCDGSTTAPCLNVADFSCFLNEFAAGSSHANCDHSTLPPVLNVADFSCFLNEFAAGCSGC
jgi:Lectin C-type domain